MKKIMAIVALVSASFSFSVALAANDCSVSCSQQCVDLAKQVVANCEGNQGPNDPDIVSACRQYFSGDDMLTCARTARSVDVIKSCRQYFSGSDVLLCSQTARSSEIVATCRQYFSGSDIMTCVQTARSSEIIKSCRQNFSGSDVLKCLGK